MNNRDLEKYLSIARAAALNAGKFLANYDRKKIKTDAILKRDIKLSADKESEKIITDILSKGSPFSILSEEMDYCERGQKDDPIWIVDPLDGTVNFFQGIPFCCVSIALWQDKKPLLGVVYDFNRDELFIGVLGRESTLNGKKIAVSGKSSPGDSVLAFGVAPRTDFTSGALEKYIKLTRAFGKMRQLGSATLAVIYVACGRMDAYFEKDTMIWDVAAGLAILDGAGGKYKIGKSKIKNSLTIYAQNGHLPDKL